MWVRMGWEKARKGWVDISKGLALQLPSGLVVHPLEEDDIEKLN